ncbi:carbohydrate ABC transporter permease [Lapidilactobacillus achengensis]|uniref:Carbohydrate ABC transporter permease n=1 Tax=Lapidilactobacillus achengensis TaxID=2486000 RepID=A0ABW1UR35_9LACO|nr:carbohydrate ABC transporter permease [Lapidilactobacillus achengensis]
MVRRNRKSLGVIINSIILLLIAACMVIPILNILAQSLTSPDRMQDLSGLSIIPKGFTFQNYQILFSNPQVTRSIFISIFLTVCGTALSLFLTAITAYVLTRPSFVGKNFFMIMLIIFMVFEPGLVQEYFVVKDLGLINSLWSIILYRTIDVYYLIILMRFFEEIPESIMESADIDGAGHFTKFTKIVLPLSKTAMATMGLFYGVFRWNEYFRASIYINDPSKWPLQVLMRQFVVLNDNSSMMNSSGALSAEVLKSIDFNSLKAGTIIVSIIPLILLYPFVLKFFTEGTMDGGVKE